MDKMDEMNGSSRRRQQQHTKAKRVEQKGRFTITEFSASERFSDLSDQDLDQLQQQLEDHQLQLESEMTPQSDAVGHGHFAHPLAPTVHGTGDAASFTGSEGSSVSHILDDVLSLECPPLLLDHLHLPQQRQQQQQAQEERRIKRKGRFTIIEHTGNSPCSHSIDASDIDLEPSTSLNRTASIEISQQQQKREDKQRAHSYTKESVLRHAAKSRNHRSGTDVSTRRPTSTGNAPFRRQSEPTVFFGDTSFHSGSLGSFGSTGSFSGYMPTTNPIVHSASFSGGLSGETNGLFGTPPMPSPPSLSQKAAEELGGDRRHFEAGSERRHLLSRQQKSVTIPAAQFALQQHMLSTLIQQQQELKQFITILQQQQLEILANQNSQLQHLEHNNMTCKREKEMEELEEDLKMLTDENNLLRTRLRIVEAEKEQQERKCEQLLEESERHRLRCEWLETKLHKNQTPSARVEPPDTPGGA